MSGVSDYDTTASNNTPAGTESIRSGDDQIRQMKADIASYTRAGSDLASASTLDLDSVDSLWLAVTGTTTVTAVTLAEGHTRHVRATGVFQITASASLIVNGSTTVNYTTTAGDLLFFEGYGSSVVRVWIISGAPATQAEQEAGSSTGKFVTPGRQHFHPSAAKGWGQANAAGTVAGSYNLTSVNDVGTGDIEFNWTTPFSATGYAAVATANNGLAVIITTVQTHNVNYTRVRTWNTGGTASDPVFHSCAVFGDQ